MKFTDGLWLLREGVKPAFGLSVVKEDRRDDTLNLQVATRPIRHRGDTLGGPVLDVQLTSPAEGIIGVNITHFAGQKKKGPEFELFPDGAPTKPNIQITKSETGTSFTSGGLTARVATQAVTMNGIATNSYYIDFLGKDGRLLTSAGPKSQAVVDIPYKFTIGSAANTSCMTTDRSSNPNPPPPPEYVRYILSELTLSAGELVYGMGEQFGGYIKNGQVISVWNRDGGTSSEQAYKCVPFYITSKGYGVFINHPGEVEFEVGSEKASRVGTSVAGEQLQYYVIYGPTPLEVLEKYTLLTGRPGGFLTGMKERNCDVSVFHLDCFWMAQYEWTSFTFDPDNFPNPKEYLASLKKQFGVKICVWSNQPIYQSIRIHFNEGVEGDYLIKRTNGDVWQWNLWQPGLAIVDVTNPAAREWYKNKLRTLLDLGVDAFKTDFGERIPHANVQYHDGSDPYRMHNAYAQIYNKLVFEVLEERFGKDEACVFARSATAGGQRFPVHWGGDCESTWEAMAETLRGGLSLTLSGFGFTSHDIGGFEGHPPAEIYMRWLAFGLFSSHSRLHGSSSYRVPWNYGEEASKVLAKFLDAKHRLMPYLYAAAIEAHETGHPVQRATFLEFPNDRTSYFLDAQYFLGHSLLVIPVFAPDTEEIEFYVPTGRWTPLFGSTKVITGPAWVRAKVPYDEIPVLVRQGTILALGKPDLKRANYQLNKELEIRVYELADGRLLRLLSQLASAPKREPRFRQHGPARMLRLALLVVH
ncbi:glycoside hydrolase family 31 protein [Rhizoctonia solani]|uniref:Glycoside hydrolase family 31 protein n=1 Tax=Rhizoctonia solani TaxID=456999 RepID=A0A8H8NNT7_9AGAM|nr:glycoside hydrolase family 31 protein [Rhizoctonia solani]QRW15933.1 glycoside hydrolase family 31 protein [Rhizoctonia solani]